MSLLNTLATAARATQENFIDDFTAETLKLLGFNERGTTVSTRYVIPLTMCGEANRVAQTDVCLIHRPTSILLVQTPSNRTNAEAQVIAESIAAFQFNNRKRSERGLDPLDAMTIPVITMTGTRPTSCLVPVTLELSDAVISGQHLVIQTRVLRCVRFDPLAARQHWDGEYGVQKACFETFPRFQDACEKSLDPYFGRRLDGVLSCCIGLE